MNDWVICWVPAIPASYSLTNFRVENVKIINGPGHICSMIVGKWFLTNFIIHDISYWSIPKAKRDFEHAPIQKGRIEENYCKTSFDNIFAFSRHISVLAFSPPWCSGTNEGWSDLKRVSSLQTSFSFCQKILNNQSSRISNSYCRDKTQFHFLID